MRKIVVVDEVRLPCVGDKALRIVVAGPETQMLNVKLFGQVPVVAVLASHEPDVLDDVEAGIRPVFYITDEQKTSERSRVAPNDLIDGGILLIDAPAAPL